MISPNQKQIVEHYGGAKNCPDENCEFCAGEVRKAKRTLLWAYVAIAGCAAAMALVIWLAYKYDGWRVYG